jgi:hypothetical protein
MTELPTVKWRPLTEADEANDILKDIIWEKEKGVADG